MKNEYRATVGNVTRLNNRQIKSVDDPVPPDGNGWDNYDFDIKGLTVIYLWRRQLITNEIEKIILSKNFIGAVKRYRELTGVPLKEAKECCDSLREQLRSQGHDI